LIIDRYVRLVLFFKKINIYHCQEKDTQEHTYRMNKLELIQALKDAHDYGILLWLGKGKWEDSFKYFKKSAEEGFEPAYGQLGTIYYLEN
jgi:hypothetical protein